MRRKKQILMTVLMTAALAALAWSAGSSTQTVDLAEVVVALEPIPAGSMIDKSQIKLIEIPSSLLTGSSVTRLDAADGSWTTTPIESGEILNSSRLFSQAQGVNYPDPGPGRRLLTLNMKTADANGFWISSGSLVDLYLIPRGAEADSGLEILENIRIIGLAIDMTDDASGNLQATGSGLICVDVSREQADVIMTGLSRCEIRLSAINETLNLTP